MMGYLVMKVGEKFIQWANYDKSDDEENDGNDKGMNINDTYKSVQSQSVMVV